MPKNILNQIKEGKIFTYSDLQKQWNELKSNPKDSNYGFLSSIFGMDNAKNTYSKSIFSEIEKSDNQDGISAKDIENLANQRKDTSYVANSKIQSITKDDFNSIYQNMFTKKAIDNENNPEFKYGDFVSEFSEQKKKVNADPLYVLKNGNYLSDDEAKNLTQTRINEAKDRIINYAAAHKEDSKIQEYTKLLQESKISLSKNDGAVAEVKFDKGKELNFYYNHPEYYEDEKNVTCMMLHELEHMRNNDDLSSKKEENTAETYAMEIACKIHNTDNIYGSKEIDAKHLKEFAPSYSEKPDNSPGYGGLPEGLGLGIDGEIQNIQKNKDGYMITSKKDNKIIELKVFLDEKGKPIKAEQNEKFYFNDTSEEYKNIDYSLRTQEISGYDETNHSFTKMDLDKSKIVYKKQ